MNGDNPWDDIRAREAAEAKEASAPGRAMSGEAKCDSESCLNPRDLHHRIYHASSYEAWESIARDAVAALTPTSPPEGEGAREALRKKLELIDELTGRGDRNGFHSAFGSIHIAAGEALEILASQAPAQEEKP